MGVVSYNDRTLIVDDREILLYAGEIHSFRLPPDKWEPHLSRMKDANLNTATIYVPWNWHEPAEGQLDLDGRTHPQRNVRGFLELIGDMRMYCVLRFGPFITSEWRNGGIPTWLYDKHPQIMSLGPDGSRPSLEEPYPPICYLHPDYERYALKWLTDIVKLSVPYLWSNGGPIIMLQLDDEPNYWQRLRMAQSVDYNPIVIGDESGPGFYQQWLESEYGTIKRLNTRYHAQYNDFLTVPPPRKPPERPEEIPWHLDWHYCKLAMINEHVLHLYDGARSAGFDAPISVLYPYLLAYNAHRLVNHLADAGRDVILTTECYPSLYGTGSFTVDKLGNVFGTNQAVHSWNRRQVNPPLSMESQSSFAYHIARGSMEALYVQTLGCGINGINYYMMVGGMNPKGFSQHTGGSYDIDSPIGFDGEIREHYHAIRELGAFLHRNLEAFLGSRPSYDLALGYYEPYDALAFVGPTLDAGLNDDYREFREKHYSTAWGPTLMAHLPLLGYNYALVNLVNLDVEEWLSYPALVVASLDFMGDELQQKLVEYVERGGKLLLFPRIPRFNEDFEQSDTLATLFPYRPLTELKGRSGSLAALDSVSSADDSRGAEMIVHDYVHEFELGEDAIPLAYADRTGKPCSYMIRRGDGRAILNGFKFSQSWDSQRIAAHFMHALLARLGVERGSYDENGNLIVNQRCGPNGSFLCISNPHDKQLDGRFHFTDGNGRRREIPSLGYFTFRRQGGRIASVDISVSEQFGIVYVTGYLVDYRVTRDEIELVTVADIDEESEISLRVPRVPTEYHVVGGTVQKSRYQDDTRHWTVRIKHRERELRLDVSCRSS